MDYPPYQLADEDLQELQHDIAEKIDAFLHTARVPLFRLFSLPQDMEYMAFEADLDNVFFIPREGEATREQSIHNWAAKIAEAGNGTLAAVEIDYGRGTVSVLVKTGITALIQEKAETMTTQQETAHA